MKRILFFSLTYHPFIGGAEIAIKEVTDRIAPEEYQFDMITLRFDSNLPKFERVGNIDIFRIGFGTPGARIEDFKKFPLNINKYLYPFWALGYAIVLHRRKAYDAVCSVMTSYASFAPLFFKFLYPKVPYIMRADDGDPIEHLQYRTRLIPFLFKRIFTKADYAIASSTYLQALIRSMGYTGEITVVPNGVDAKRFSQIYTDEELFALKQKLGKQPGDVFLITTSRLVKKNATEEVIRALPLLEARVKFLILGVGPDEPMLRALADELKVTDRVKFLRHISHNEIPKYLKVSDIFTRPSRSEGFGISFAEAMAAGIPVIATPVGGIPDFLFDPDINFDQKPTGLFCKVDDPQSIAKQVRRLITDTSLRDQVIVNAKKLVTEKYDWNLIAKDMKEMVFDIILSN
jgi:glycosyltransferase involved in cell wall biosynthesis